jgi:AcrR family transcriptional regulator
MQPATRATRGDYAKTAIRRQEIIQAAVEVYSGVGFRKGSLRDVADKVGLSQAGLLHHFRSKDELLRAVLAWRDEESLKRMGPSVQRGGVHLVRALIELADYNASTPELVELHVVLSAEATSPDHPVHEYFVQRYANLVKDLQVAFEEAAAAGHVRKDVDPRSAAQVLIAMMDGLQIQWLLDRSSVDIAAELRSYLSSLLTTEV